MNTNLTDSPNQKQIVEQIRSIRSKRAKLGWNIRRLKRNLSKSYLKLLKAKA